MNLDQIFISLNIDADGVKKGISNAESYIKTGMSSIVSLLAPLAGGALLSSAFSSFADGAKEVGKYADLLGLSVQDMQAWQGAAEAMGAEGAEINEMLIDMNEYLVDMVQYGSGPAVDILNSLGIAATDATGNIRPAVDVLLDMAEAGEKVSKQEMLAYGKIMGFDKSVIDLLMLGRRGLTDLLTAQKELAVYTQEDAELSKEWSLNLQMLQKGLAGLNAIIMREVMPAVTYFTNGVSQFVLFLRKNEGFTKAFFGTLGALAVAVGIKMSVAFAPIILLVGAIGAAIGVVALVVDDFITYLDGGQSALSDFWAIFGTGEEISEGLASAWEALKAVGDWLWESLTNRVKDFFTAFGPAIDGIKDMFTGFATFLVGLFTGDFTKMGDGLTTYFGGAIDTIKGMFTGLFDFIWSGIERFTGGLISGVQGVASWLGFGGDEDGSKTEALQNFSDNMGFGLQSASDFGSFGASQADAVATNTPSYNRTNQTNNTQNTVSTTVGHITINTNATDANGIAREIQPAIKNRMSNLVMASNMGVTK